MWCAYCETGDSDGIIFKHGYMWIHAKCFEEICEKQNDSIAKFIERTEEFQRKWNNSMKLIKEVYERCE